MAAMILNSARAVEMSVYVVRAFVQLRVVLASNSELAQRVTKLERGHESHDSAIVGILKTLHEMQTVPQTRAIGYVELDEKKKSGEPAMAFTVTNCDLEQAFMLQTNVRVLSANLI